MLKEEDLPAEARHALGTSHRDRINALVCDVIDHSWAATGLLPTTEGPPVIAMSPPTHSAANAVREFMFERVFLHPTVATETRRSMAIVTFLFQHYRAHADQIASDCTVPDDPPERRATDYVSGMTDLYATRRTTELGFHP